MQEFSDSASFIPSHAGGGGFDGTESAVGNTIMGSGGSGVSCITFEQHSSLVRYPNSMSNLRRLRCYLLACQVKLVATMLCCAWHDFRGAVKLTCIRQQSHHIDYRKHLEELVQKDVAKALAENPVPIPHTQSVYLGIDSLSMNIRPFDELNQFRTKCFFSFANHQKRGLSLTQVLQLYVAAYQVFVVRGCAKCHGVVEARQAFVVKEHDDLSHGQVKSIWKQLWTSIYPVISPQIIRDVETFVANTPFAVKPFLEILRTSSPF